MIVGRKHDQATRSKTVSLSPHLPFQHRAVLTMSTSTYIHILNDDVLLHIFTFNADMFCADYSYYFQRMEEWNPYSCHTPLRTARKTSQVCQKWRNLMLDTPSLWAKLINMHELYYLAGNEWWDEVIRRTGEAPLWIQVYSEGSPSKYIKRNLNFELQAFKISRE